MRESLCDEKTSCMHRKHFIGEHLATSSGEELIALAGMMSVKIAECMDIEELGTLCEFLGLLKHDIEVIKFRRFLKKADAKK